MIFFLYGNDSIVAVSWERQSLLCFGVSAVSKWLQELRCPAPQSPDTRRNFQGKWIFLFIPNLVEDYLISLEFFGSLKICIKSPSYSRFKTRNPEEAVFISLSGWRCSFLPHPHPNCVLMGSRIYIKAYIKDRK